VLALGGTPPGSQKVWVPGHRRDLPPGVLKRSLVGPQPQWVPDTIKHVLKRLAAWGNHFFIGHPGIAPLRGALAVWGLTPDDIGMPAPTFSIFFVRAVARQILRFNKINIMKSAGENTKGRSLSLALLPLHSDFFFVKLQ
jgi:hypothetical protein